MYLRHWCQFSMRSLVLLGLLFAIGCSKSGESAPSPAPSEITDRALLGCEKGVGLDGSALKDWVRGFLCAQAAATAREAKDYSTAFRMATKACELKSPKGCLELGICYGFGHGTEQDMEKALRHNRTACAGGHVPACEMLEELGVSVPTRPANMPCRVEKRWSKGNLGNYWTLVYDKARRLVRARDEAQNQREAALAYQTPEKVESEMAKEPFTIGYEYDDAGRLVRYASKPGDTIEFEYKDGQLAGYSSGSDGAHELQLDSDGRVIRNRSTMPGIGQVSVRYEYDGKGVAPLAYGNGSTFYGESRVFFTFPGKPEKKLSESQFDGPSGVVNRIQTYHLDGTRAESYHFLYKCSDEQTYKEIEAAGLVPKVAEEPVVKESGASKYREKVDRFRTMVYELASNCEDVKRQTAAAIADGLRLSRGESQRYWEMWSSDRDPTGLPEVPTMIIGFKKQQIQAWMLSLVTIDDSTIPLPCQEALKKAALAAGDNCIGSGSPRQPKGVLTMAAEACGLDPRTPSTSLCGSTKALSSATSRPGWASWGCRTRKQADARWSECVERKVYTDDKKAGCPGKARCCPTN